MFSFGYLAANYTDMGVYNIKEVLGNLCKELKSSLGSRNMVNLDVDRKIPSMMEGEAPFLVNILRGMAEMIANSLVNGIIHIEIGYSERGKEIPLEICITGAGLSDQKCEKIQEKINQVFPNLHVEYRTDGQKMAVSFTFLVTPVSDVEDELFAFKDKKILLAEDNEVNIIVFSNFLEEWGTHNKVARNGLEAAELAKANTYDAILMDLHMPVMDGIEAIQEIRKSDTTIPIIVLSGISYQKEIARALESGANEFLKKPVSSWELFFSLSKFLS